MCREMQQYIADFRVNINVSYIQIMRGSMANKILSAIQANNLRPESICIEMTESGFMDMTPCFCSFRKKLDENNIQFIIDDFGTGYSNEKEEWACAMKEIHVDYMQGYLYGRPCEKGVFLNNYGI